MLNNFYATTNHNKYLMEGIPHFLKIRGGYFLTYQVALIFWFRRYFKILACIIEQLYFIKSMSKSEERLAKRK